MRWLWVFSLVVAVSMWSPSGISAAARGEAQPKYALLHVFSGKKDGDLPDSPLIVDNSGNVFGATSGGGKGYGVIYEIQANPLPGTTRFRVLRTFAKGEDGNGPDGLALAPNGTLYGITERGGLYGSGVFFQLTPSESGQWDETPLYDFRHEQFGHPYPSFPSTLYPGPDGVFYGTASGGTDELGTVYELLPPDFASPAWSEVTLHSFQGDSDSGYPGPLSMSDNGAIFGVTTLDEDNVFELLPPQSIEDRWRYEVIHTFGGGKEGGPLGLAAVVATRSGLFGTISGGGKHGWGVLYKLTPTTNPTWAEHILWTFDARMDGGGPFPGLTPGRSNSLYGVTMLGGAKQGIGEGVVYKISPRGNGEVRWHEQTLHVFSTNGDGVSANSIPVLYNKHLYGTTSCYAKRDDGGVVYRLHD